MKKITFIVVMHLCLTSFAQNLLTGTVSNESGAIVGATVIVKNSNRGAVSDFNGYFEIMASPSETISISYVGYPTKELTVGNNSFFKVVLEGEIALDEVILYAYDFVTHTCKLNCSWGCTTTSCGVEVLSQDIVVENSLQQKLFPNPSVDGLFNFNLGMPFEKLELFVSNLNGQTIKSVSFVQENGIIILDLSEFPTGIYLVNIIADGKKFKTKRAIRK